MSLIVNPSFSNSYKNFNDTRQSLITSLPEEIFLEIFSYLNLATLGTLCCVSKEWSKLASEPILWKTAIYREFAFSSKNWIECDADFVKDVDIRQEMLSLPNNIKEELRRSAFPGKSIRKTHVLVRIPKGVTIKKLGEFAKKYFSNNTDGYRYILPRIANELGDDPANASAWLLMTKNILSGSRSKRYRQQKNAIAEFAKKTGVPYQVPTILEAVTCIFATYSYSKSHLFSDNPLTYTRCQYMHWQKNVEDYQIVVGSFSSRGLIVNTRTSCESKSVGVAALRKF